MAFISVSAGQQIRATHVQQFTSWLTAGKVDTPGTIAATSTTEYTLTVRSQDGGTGLALNVLYGSATSPSTIATFNKSQILLAAPVVVTGTTPLAAVQMAAPASGPGVGYTSLYPKTDGTWAFKTGTSATENVLASAASGTSYLLNPLTAAGDLLYSSSGTTAARLAIGTARQALIVNSGATAPTWGASLQSLMTAEGDLVYAQSANTPIRLARGSADQVLAMHSNGNIPVWTAVTTAGLAANAVSTVAYVAGSTSDPSTTSATLVTLTDMSQTLTTVGGDLEVDFSGAFYQATAVGVITVGISLDGAAAVTAARRTVNFVATTELREISTFHVFTGVSATAHTVAVLWSTSTGTAFSFGVQRALRVRERKR